MEIFNAFDWAAGGIVFSTVMGIDFWTGAVILVVATGIYTVPGGLRAVLYTDLIQMFVLIGGAVLVTVTGLMKLGGPRVLFDTAGPKFFNMWKPMTDPDIPGPESFSASRSWESGTGVRTNISSSGF